MRFVGSTVIDVDTSGLHLQDVVRILQEHLATAASDNDSVIDFVTYAEDSRVTIRMELEAKGSGYLDEIAEAVFDAAIAATQRQLESKPESMTVLGSSLLPA